MIRMLKKKFHIERLLIVLLTMVVLIVALGATAMAATYYLTAAGAGAAQTAGNWNTVAAGGGTAATNFTTTGDVFNIPSGISGIVSANWPFGSNGNTRTLTLTIDGSLTINNGVTLTLQNCNAGGVAAMTVDAG
ncbi:MAG: hypothetical protein WAV76_02390, partial [Bacteroidota bacterium]